LNNFVVVVVVVWMGGMEVIYELEDAVMERDSLVEAVKRARPR
jgi:hypothetical protein